MTKLLTVAEGLTLGAVLFAGCSGGADDRATVEAGLRHYLSTFSPEGSAFPSGAGPPRVKHEGCKDLNRKVDPRPLPGWNDGDKKVALWLCVVSFKRLTLPVAVAVNDSTEVVWAWPGGSDTTGTTGSPPRT